MTEHLSISLYTTLGCHLCEDAMRLLQACRQKSGLEFTVVPVEISDEQSLVDDYGIRIPVLRHSLSQQELDWPFSAEQLLDFIKAH